MLSAIYQWIAEWLVPDRALMWPQSIIWWDPMGNDILLRVNALHDWNSEFAQR